MEYMNLGRCGLKVSRIALGCMSYDRNGRDWHLDEAGGRQMIRRALDLGITFFDTANMYSGGESEEVLGRAIRDFVPRDQVVLATKVYFRMRSDPNGAGLSRKAILSEVDASLRRLRTDYIDLYQIHRYDYDTPIEETLEALHDLVKSGKVRYLGASSMFVWQFSRALHIAERNGWARFVSMQNHYNLLYREEEREMLPVCANEGIGVIPWSPLARGRLARPWRANSSTDRVRVDETARILYSGSEAVDERVVARVHELASARGVPMARIALAWLLQRSTVVAPIVGATQERHLDDAIAALTIHLDAEELASLEADYAPHAVVGHS